jgi:DMATS type aromatic prenyltransferase
MASLRLSVRRPVSRYGLLIPARTLKPALTWSQRRCNTTTADPKVRLHDVQVWSDACRPIVDVLLQHSGTYTPKEQQAHLRFLDEAIVPNLGPSPAPTYKCTSLLTGDGTPFRPSWNFSGHGTATLRLGYDPIGPESGNATDPFRQKFLRNSLTAFADAAEPTADMTWYKEVMEAMYLTPEEEASLQARWSSDAPRPPHHFFAYGCKGMKRDFKPYFHPFLKTQATGKSSAEVIYDGIRSVRTLKDELDPAVNLVKQYTDARTDVFVPHMIGVDCVEPKNARLKLYGMAPSNAWNLMEDVMTLGGRLTDPETMRGVQMFREIYPLLMNEERGALDPARSKEPRNPGTAHKGTIHSFEMKPGRELPEPKVYLPIWQFAEKEGQNVATMQKIFRRFGWNDTADRYALALQGAL